MKDTFVWKAKHGGWCVWSRHLREKSKKILSLGLAWVVQKFNLLGYLRNHLKTRTKTSAVIATPMGLIHPVSFPRLRMSIVCRCSWQRRKGDSTTGVWTLCTSRHVLLISMLTVQWAGTNQKACCTAWLSALCKWIRTRNVRNFFQI